MQHIGYWYAWSRSGREFPDPKDLVDPCWLEEERERLIAYLRSGITYRRWRGFSSCRFKCGIADQEMGFRDFTDGVWVWPEGLYHYVAEHHVMLPDEFASHCRQNRWTIPPGVEPGDPAREIDTTFWINWAISMLGGCIVEVACPKCGRNHRMIRNLQLRLSPASAGSVAELYAGEELPSVLVVLLGDKVWCDKVGHYVQQPDPARMFLTPQQGEIVAE